MSRPSETLADSDIRDALLAVQPDLMPHHLDALVPCVRLAIDCEVVGKASEAVGCLYRAAYWSSVRPAVKLFRPDLLDRIHLKAVIPLAMAVCEREAQKPRESERFWTD